MRNVSLHELIDNVPAGTVLHLELRTLSSLLSRHQSLLDGGIWSAVNYDDAGAEISNGLRDYDETSTGELIVYLRNIEVVHLLYNNGKVNHAVVASPWAVLLRKPAVIISVFEHSPELFRDLYSLFEPSGDGGSTNYLIYRIGSVYVKIGKDAPHDIAITPFAPMSKPQPDRAEAALVKLLDALEELKSHAELTLIINDEGSATLQVSTEEPSGVSPQITSARTLQAALPIPVITTRHRHDDRRGYEFTLPEMGYRSGGRRRSMD